MGAMTLTVLVANEARVRGLLAEHGLSFWIEHGRERILFDTGQSAILRHNAGVLGIDLETADAVVLSHGHYDHTGGLGAVLAGGGHMRVVAHPAAFAPKYGRHAQGPIRYIGMPPVTREALASRSGVVAVTEPLEICRGVFLTGPIPRQTDFEDTGGLFFTDAQGLLPDELEDDQAAFIETPDGLVVVLGCAHAGIINTLRYVRELLPGRPIHTVIGGMHMAAASEARLQGTLEALRAYEIQRLIPLHCTGFEATARLWEIFSPHVSDAPVGTRLSWG